MNAGWHFASRPKSTADELATRADADAVTRRARRAVHVRFAVVTTPGQPVEAGRADDSPTTADLQVRAMHGSWWTAVQALIGLPVTVVVNLVVARTLGPHGYGTLASYLTAYALIFALVSGGVSDATVQWGAAAYARGDRPDLRSITRRCAGYHVYIKAPLAAFAAFFLLGAAPLKVQLLGALAVGVTMLLDTPGVVLTAMSYNAVLAKLVLVGSIAVQLSVVTAAVQSHEAEPTWVARMAAGWLVPLLTFVVAPRDIRRASVRPSFPLRWPTGFWSYALLTMVAGVLTSLVFSRSELLVLDAYGQTANAGVFALAAGLAGQITAPIDAMLGPLLPAAAALLAIDRTRAAAAVERGLRLSTLALSPLALVAIPAVAILIPSLYGSRFGTSGDLFVALAAVSCLQSVLHPVTAFMIALRMPRAMLLINGCSLIVDLGLVFALAPSLGATGAVIGNVAGQIFSLTAASALLSRHLDVDLSAMTSAVAPFGGAVLIASAAAASGLWAHAHGVDVAIAVLGAVGSGAVIAMLAVRAVRGIVTDADLASVTDAFPRFAPTIRAVCCGLGLIRSF